MQTNTKGITQQEQETLIGLVDKIESSLETLKKTLQKDESCYWSSWIANSIMNDSSEIQHICSNICLRWREENKVLAEANQ